MFYLYCYSYCKHQSIIVRDVWQNSGNLTNPSAIYGKFQPWSKFIQGVALKIPVALRIYYYYFFDGIAIIPRECYFQSYS